LIKSANKMSSWRDLKVH